MAAPVPIQRTIHEDQNTVTRLIYIPGDGDADISTPVVVADLSALTSGATPTDFVFLHACGHMRGFNAILSWDATSDVPFWTIGQGSSSPGEGRMIREAGGVTNNAGAGKTGDIVLTTSGYAATEAGMFILKLKKVV